MDSRPLGNGTGVLLRYESPGNVRWLLTARLNAPDGRPIVDVAGAQRVTNGACCAAS